MEQNENEVNFLDLLVAIETSNQHLSLLIAVCDRDRLRSSLTERYEQELASEGIKSYRVTIDRQEPSLFAAINQLVEAEPYLQSGNPAVITVEGVASLSSFASEGERSPVDKFLGYLQWTREGMRQFAFPIVIWVTEHIHNEISRKAQDFYSWRQGVFFFESIQEEPIVPIDVEPIRLPESESDDLYLPIDELLVYIAQREAVGQEDSSLATFYTLLAKAYERYKQADQAISTWQKAINLQQKLDLSLELATSLNSLGGLLYSYQGNYAAAVKLIQQSLKLRQKLLGEHHIDVSTSLNNLAKLYYSQGRYKEAEPLYKESLVLRQEILGDNHPDVATSLNNLAGLYEVQGRYEEAESLYKQALALRKELLGNHHPDVANSLNDLAGLYESQGKYEAAEPFYLQSLEIYYIIYGKYNPAIATALNNLAELYRVQGRYEEAEPLYKQSLALRQELLEQHHPDIARSLNNLALLYYSQRKYEEAESLYKQALILMQEVLGDRHPDVATSLNNLADVYCLQERYEEAEPLYKQALALKKELFGHHHPSVATSLNSLAVLRYNQHRYNEADALLLQALEILEAVLGSDHPHTRTAKESLAYLRTNHQS